MSSNPFLKNNGLSLKEYLLSHFKDKKVGDSFAIDLLSYERNNFNVVLNKHIKPMFSYKTKTDTNNKNIVWVLITDIKNK